MGSEQPEPEPAEAASTTDSFQACLARNPVLWNELTTEPGRFRVLTGERTTGKLHVGHYFGSLANRVVLQDRGVETYLVMADYQAITDRDAGSELRDSVYEILLDYLAIGIDPTRTTIFCHSMVGALNQLLLPFLSIVSMAELQRNPTVKDEIKMSGQSKVSGLMMTYPVHQAADILFCHGNVVPGGKDQLPHIELTRLIARRMNNLYFGGEPYFPEPDLLLSDAPLLLGLDGRKMGKSLNNAIYLGMTEDETAAALRKAKTDADATITYDPVARPEVSNLLLLASLCSGRTPEDIAAELGSSGGSGLKGFVTEALNERFAEIRKRRLEYATDPAQVWAVLRDGVARANATADETLERVRAGMGMDYFRDQP
jgi:tryptophanyl-tRNA synthetase